MAVLTFACDVFPIKIRKQRDNAVGSSQLSRVKMAKLYSSNSKVLNILRYRGSLILLFNNLDKRHTEFIQT
jgi:hypothetical protein